MAKLVYTDPNGMERFVEVGQQNSVVMIGRNPDCGIQTSDPSVSRVHAMVTYKDGRLCVQDPPNCNRPTNGTRIDGMRLNAGEKLELYAGSELLCGKFKVRILSDNSQDSIPQMGEAAPSAQQYVQQARDSAIPVNISPQQVVAVRTGNAAPYASYSGPMPNGYQQPMQGGMPMQANYNAPQPMPAYNQNQGTNVGPMNQGTNVGAMNQGANVGPMNANGVHDQRENTRAKYDPRRVAAPGGQSDARGPYDAPRSTPESVRTFEGSRIVSYDSVRGKRPDRSTRAPSNYHPGQNHPAQNVAQTQNQGMNNQVMNPVQNVQPMNPQQGMQPMNPMPNAQPVNMAMPGNMNDMMRELEELRAFKASHEEEIKNLKTKLDENEREIADFTQRCDCHETVTAGFKEMIDKLKEQLEHQKEQNKETKKDLLESQERNEELEIELSSLKESLESKGMATSNAETTIADLKVQLSQKTRQLSDTQRELDLSQYNVKEERENVNRLEENVAELNAALEESQRHCRDMKKIVEQHEVKYGDLRSNLEERAQEIRQLQDALRKQGGGDTAAMLNELNQTKEMLRVRTTECEDARRKFIELQNQYVELQNHATNSTVTVGGPDMDHLREVASAISDGIGQWRGDLATLENSISDLQRVFVPYVRLDLNSIPGPDRSRIEAVLCDYDPKLIFEDIGNALDMSSACLGELKGQVMELKTSLELDH